MHRMKFFHLWWSHWTSVIINKQVSHKMIEYQGAGLAVILMEGISILLVRKEMLGIMTMLAIGTAIMFYVV